MLPDGYLPRGQACTLSDENVQTRTTTSHQGCLGQPEHSVVLYADSSKSQQQPNHTIKTTKKSEGRSRNNQTQMAAPTSEENHMRPKDSRCFRLNGGAKDDQLIVVRRTKQCRREPKTKLTNAAKASQNTRGHSAFFRADTCAATAPSKAQNKNNSSRWGKCSHMERDRRRHAKMGLSLLSSSPGNAFAALLLRLGVGVKGQGARGRVLLMPSLVAKFILARVYYCTVGGSYKRERILARYS